MKGHILHDSFVEYPNKEFIGEIRFMIMRGRAGKNEELLDTGIGLFSGMIKMFWNKIECLKQYCECIKYH